MSIDLLDRNTGYPEVFYQELEILNARKPLDAPVAVVLKACTRNAYLADLPRIIQMTKTHRIVLQRLDRDHSIGQNIKEAYDKTGKFSKKLVILSHGCEGDIALDEEEVEESEFSTQLLYSKESVRSEDFEYLDPNAQIFLSGCYTGSGGLDSLAQRIADVSRRIVFAPKEILIRAATCFWEYPDGNWKMMSYQPGEGIQHVYKFRRGRIPRLSSNKTLGEALRQSKDKKNIRDLFNTYASSMYHYAQGNSQFQVDMGDFCRLGIPGCYPEDGIHWLLSAAEEGNDPEAQYTLGIWYDEAVDMGNVEKSPENAFYWYRLAASQGHTKAQYNTGVCLHYGRGCERSESRALHYFQQAADKGHPEALDVVGRYFELGRGGLPVSKQCALFYFGLALQKGFEPARKEFDQLKWELEMDALTPEQCVQVLVENLQGLRGNLERLQSIEDRLEEIRLSNY